MRIKFPKSLSPHLYDKRFKPLDLLFRSRELLIGYGLSSFPDNIHIETCERNELKENYPSKWNDGIQAFIVSYVDKGDHHHRIYVLRHLDYLSSISYVSHELGHAWIIENATNAKVMEDLDVEEGFCTFLQYLVIQGESKELAKVFLNQNMGRRDVYGQGLTLMMTAYETNGILGVLSLLE